ncbi:MAG TPA: hypothetical protein VMJ14_09920 [Burkholderiales bacterium]|nr:hypothetical protein [Burkholderiales bacterium]
MEESGVISGYVESLAGKLAFDRSLARCVRQEVEDHLREAVAAGPEGNALEAERRAVANFGDPEAIAAQFALLSLARQSRKAGVAVVLVIGGVFFAMKARIAWFALTQWVLSEEARAVSAYVVAIDRYAFWLSAVVGLAAWVTISRRRAPAALHPSYRGQLRRFFLLCAIAAGGLLASVICDGVLSAIRLVETELSADFLVPVFSMAIEVACAAVLVFHIRCVARRMASTAALARTAHFG